MMLMEEIATLPPGDAAKMLPVWTERLRELQARVELLQTIALLDEYAAIGVHP